MKKILFWTCLLLICCSSCQKQIPVRLASFTVYKDYKSSPDSVWLTLQKQLPGPIHSYLKSSIEEVNQKLERINPIIFTDSLDRRTVAIAHQNQDSLALRNSFSGKNYYGNPYQLDTQLLLAWPFPKGKKHKIVQAYNGSFSHQTPFSKYAIDFSLAVGDTICAAQNGLIVSVLQENTKGGNDPKYRDFGNFITIYHPDGYLTQYAHIQYKGSLVKAGDRVEKGQAIGLAGITGYTGGPHLHFNVLKPVIGDILSTPAVFEKMAGKNLKKGMWVEH